MTPQQQMKAKLESVGLPFKEINVYGNQIMVTSHCRETAERWAGLLRRFAKIKAIGPGIDDAKVNRNTVLVPSVVKVWRTWATI